MRRAASNLRFPAWAVVTLSLLQMTVCAAGSAAIGPVSFDLSHPGGHAVSNAAASHTVRARSEEASAPGESRSRPRADDGPDRDGPDGVSREGRSASAASSAEPGSGGGSRSGSRRQPSRRPSLPGAGAAIALLALVLLSGAASANHLEFPNGTAITVANVVNKTGVPDCWSQTGAGHTTNATYANISWAVSNSTAGDAIVVCGGNYSENTIIINTRVTLIANNTTYDAILSSATGQRNIDIDTNGAGLNVSWMNVSGAIVDYAFRKSLANRSAPGASP